MLIKPTAKRKTSPIAKANDPECTYGCFGMNKWAENEIVHCSWYKKRKNETSPKGHVHVKQKKIFTFSEENLSGACPFKSDGHDFTVLLCGFKCVFKHSPLMNYICTSPSRHFRVVVDRYIGTNAVIVGAKMAVGGTKPFVKAMLQR